MAERVLTEAEEEKLEDVGSRHEAVLKKESRSDGLPLITEATLEELARLFHFEFDPKVLSGEKPNGRIHETYPAAVAEMKRTFQQLNQIEGPFVGKIRDWLKRNFSGFTSSGNFPVGIETSAVGITYVIKALELNGGQQEGPNHLFQKLHKIPSNRIDDVATAHTLTTTDRLSVFDRALAPNQIALPPYQVHLQAGLDIIKQAAPFETGFHDGAVFMYQLAERNWNVLRPTQK